MVSARASRAGHSFPLGRTLGENADASRWKTTWSMSWKSVGVASWALLMVSVTLVMSVGVVGPRVGTWLKQLSDGKPLVQDQLANRNGQALACTHFTTGQCVHNCGVIRGTGPEVTTGPMFLGTSC